MGLGATAQTGAANSPPCAPKSRELVQKNGALRPVAVLPASPHRSLFASSSTPVSRHQHPEDAYDLHGREGDRRNVGHVKSLDGPTTTGRSALALGANAVTSRPRYLVLAMNTGP